MRYFTVATSNSVVLHRPQVLPINEPSTKGQHTVTEMMGSGESYWTITLVSLITSRHFLASVDLLSLPWSMGSQGAAGVTMGVTNERPASLSQTPLQAPSPLPTPSCAALLTVSWTLDWTAAR
jgi:hypothetical protein